MTPPLPPTRRRRAARGRTGAPRRRRAWNVVGAAGLLVLAIWLLRVARPIARPAPLPEPPDPIALMRPSDAYQTALALARQQRNLESLPYYRRAIAGVGEDFWELHYNYSSALYDLTRDFRTARGRQLPSLRSTWEQIQVMRDAVREMDRAGRLARDPRSLATVQARRAQMMEVWGFPWEAFVAYRQGRLLDAARSDLAERGDRYMLLMRSPQRVPKGSPAP